MSVKHFNDSEVCFDCSNNMDNFYIKSSKNTTQIKNVKY